MAGARLLVVVAMVSVTQTSCFMPTAFPRTIETDIPGAESRFIHEGQTSKEDLLNRFGEPDWRSAGDSRWIYEMRKYVAWGWEMCIAYQGQGGCGEVGDRPLKVEYLDIRFDDSETVKDWSTPSVKSGECIDNVACVVAESHSEGLYSGLELREGRYYEAGTTTPYNGHRETIHSNGQLASEAEFVDGLLHGSQIHYDRNGAREEERTYKDGKLNGVSRMYWKSGLKRMEAFYSDEQLHGLVTGWSRDGHILLRYCFQHGEIVNLSPDDCPK